MKIRNFSLIIRTMLTAALIAAMLTVSGGSVSAGPAKGEISSEGDSCSTIILEGVYTGRRLYADASPVSYNGSYRSEVSGDSMALMIYDALYEHSVTSPDDNSIELTVNPPYMAGDGSDFEATKAAFKESFLTASIAFLYDHPEAFWVDLPTYGFTAVPDGEGKYGVSQVTINKVEYFSGAFAQHEAVASGINTAVSAITEGDTRYDTVKNIHDYICNHSTYDYDELENGNKPRSHTIAPLFNGDGTFVCEGYAKSFKVLCDRFNIPCALVSGKATTQSDPEGQGHMWNYVRMDDGKWYGVDVTWDDQSYGISENYFLKGSNALNSDHTPKKPGGTDDSGNPFEFNIYYPPLEADDYDPDWNQGASSAESSVSQPSESGEGPSQPSVSDEGASQPSVSDEGTSSGDTSSDEQPKMIAITLDDPDNGFVKSASVPEDAKAKAGNDDVALNKIRLIVTKLDNTKKKALTDGIKKVNGNLDLDNALVDAYDIQLVDNFGNTVTITEGKLKVCLAFPSGMTKKYTSYYYFVYHQKTEGGVERIQPVKYNSQGVWFENDKFSPFALVGVEKEDPSPGTGETILFTVIAVVLLGLAAAAIAIIVIKGRRGADEDVSEDNPEDESDE